ncbi:MAG: hypothetical protein IPI57_16070 [Candidatus Competibacteraceae bacterium]|nr:hypothetical protein [Candidatus Competibacteraceae bacterium]
MIDWRNLTTIKAAIRLVIALLLIVGIQLLRTELKNRRSASIWRSKPSPLSKPERNRRR